MTNYHYTEARQIWLEKNKYKLNNYMREYMRIKRNESKNNIKIKHEITIVHFN